MKYSRDNFADAVVEEEVIVNVYFSRVVLRPCLGYIARDSWELVLTGALLE